MSKLWRKLLFLIRGERFDRDLDDEMRFHLEMKARAVGGTAHAGYVARRRFGNPLLLREESREQWGWMWLETLLQDVRYGARVLRKNPGFTFAAVCTLALGIGASTAIFSVVNAVLLRPLPYRDANQLVALWEWSTHEHHINTVAGANYADWKARNHAFADIGYSWDDVYTFTGTANPEAVFGYDFSCNFFPLLGTKPLVGRTFLPEECQAGKDHVVVLSQAVWQRRFGSDRGIIGRSIQLNHQAYTVVGVMPAEFGHPSSATALWVPLTLGDLITDRKTHVLRLVARLKNGVTLERAQAEMDALARQLAAEHPDSNAGMGVQLWPIRDFYIGQVKKSLWVLQGAVLVMLLIACANVANLLVARASARGREMAVRLALGAGRVRLVRQLLTEGMLLALLGGAAGVGLAFWGAGALVTLLPSSVASVLDPAHAAAWINMPVLMVALLLSMVSGAVFGVVPALSASASPDTTLRSSGRSLTESRGKMRVGSGLVVSQIALSLVLLAGAGLLIRSFLRLEMRDYGFRTDHVLTLQLMGSSGTEDSAGMAAFVKPLIERIEALPGVVAAGAINAPPLTGMSAHRSFTIPGQPPLPYGQQPVAGFHVVTPHYFAAMGIRLLQGRYFDDHDRKNSAGAAIINETVARRFFANQNPIGRTISVADLGTPAVREIVGVVGDTRHEELADAPYPEIYRPFSQADWSFAGIAVRTVRDPLALAPAVRAAIWALNKEQPIDGMMTLEQRAETTLAPRRANLMLLSLFAAIALVLAAIGIYGVSAYAVSRRTHEIGIRMALGAESRQVTGMVMGKALLLALGGVGIGLVAAAALTRYMESLLTDISALDAVTFVVTPAVLGAVAGLAAYLPARHASKVDPMEALRYE